MSESELLGAWWRENDSAPSDWRVLAKWLAESQYMPAAWSQLRKHGDVALAVFSDVRRAFRDSNREVMRESPRIERQKLRRVATLAHKLKAAIEASPLPKNTTGIYELQSQAHPPVVIALGWRDLNPAVHDRLGHPVAIVNILDTVVEMVEGFEKALPARAVVRHRVDPLMSAFVRYLTWLFVDRFGCEHQGTVAAIANAVLQPSDPMTKQSVQAILKDSPQPFRPKRKRNPRAA